MFPFDEEVIETIVMYIQVFSISTGILFGAIAIYLYNLWRR